MSVRPPAIVATLLAAMIGAGLQPVAGAAGHWAAAASQESARRSVWNGVFTEPQAARGGEAYQYSCATCHATDLEGDPGRDVPALYGEGFVNEWSRHSVKDLFELMRKTMPKDSPGSLRAQTYADIVAYLLQANEFPSGDQELTTDAARLERIAIDKVPPAIGR